ncbi:propionyl-CoA synthetase [Pararhizobium antarcticum]|uniref:Propionate--CoA ligase n=1 Tax=Pararhizobium antarcticum TaxID=1798805 RepID=A0A657LL61_9HYPH|nr:propionyl-CoA synthetase [Pararhizobium antarcticum]OJF91212.1 propionate--CoA ligase [Pararhizobium antarcticum]OJG01120.1 propionate--CoA ligase [Rhizobium sp. 58]
MASSYAAVYEAWKQDPQAFWAEAATAVDWFTPADTTFDAAEGVYGRWFVGAQTNTCYNCIDRHVLAGRGDQVALIYDSPVTGTVEHWTYAQMLAEVQALASVYLELGVTRGDRVIIYMPMVPQAIAAMLAASRIGAVHSVVFGGFAANELATRIDDCTPRLIVSASCGIETARIVAYKPLLDAAIDMAHHKPDHCLVFQRPQCRADLQAGRDMDYRDEVERAMVADVGTPCVPMEATDPLYILYTSGTTGQPKGVVRDTGGHMVALLWSMQHFYGLKPGDVFWTASDIGWVVGHSYIVYGPLLNGNTTVLYEGKPIGTPDAGAFWRVIAQHGVTALFTAPTAFRAIRKEDPQAGLIEDHDLSSLRVLFLAGERADPDTLDWAETVLKVPVIDHWWQTETGWPIAGNPRGLGLLAVKHGSATVPLPGYDVRILDDGGHPVTAGTLGNVVIGLPLPPGCLPTFWNADNRFRSGCLEEFPDHYKTADAGYIDDDGYIFIMARTDDIINVAGHRLSTGSMEEICASHPDVAECAVIGIKDAIKGQVPAGFLVLNANVSRETADIEREVVALVRNRIGPVAAFKTVMCIKRLPKTRSGKILRGTMQKIADGLDWKMPATIDDPLILDEIGAVLHDRGFARRTPGN